MAAFPFRFLEVFKRIAFASLVSFCGTTLFSQLTPLTPIVGEEDMVERLLIRDAGRSGIHAAMQPVTYTDVRALLTTADTLDYVGSWADAMARDQARVRLGLDERDVPNEFNYTAPPPRGWLRKTFYRTPGYALDAQRPGFRLLVNPVLDLRTGRQTNGGGYNFLNTRGVRLQGEVDDRVWFQTAIYENQEGLRSWEREWRQAYNGQVPGVGFFKAYDPILYDLPDAVDYFQATGELGFKLTKHIHFRFGHGNPSLGVGERSMLLSSFADPYLYAQIDTRIWRFHYRNLYTQLQDGTQGSMRVERKFMVAHTLSLQLAPNWEFGLTEQTVFKRDNGFDAQYLNPVILYRAVEQDNGSPDNALIGLHSNLIVGRTAMVYGQFLFDEFKFDELFLNGDQWWANKYSWQLGARYVDAFGVAGLNLLAEANTVRPFTYGHRFDGISYTHYNQPLAHPWGASLVEYTVRAEQWLSPKWSLAAKLNTLRQDDIAFGDEPHIGANVLIDNNLRAEDYGYSVAGSAPVTRTLAVATVRYRPFPGAQLEARYDYYRRNGPSADAAISQSGVSLGLSLNAWRRQGLF